jgi:flagellar protein FlaG
MPTEITSLVNGYAYKSEVAKADSKPVQAVDEERLIESGQNTLDSETIDKIESLTQIVQRSLEFRVDDETGKQVVRVIDSDTGKLVRQMPPEQILSMISQLQDAVEEMMSGIFLDDRA